MLDPLNLPSGYLCPDYATSILMFQSGKVFFGKGIGSYGITSGEICFNTSITGYQEIITDPSYNGQIINFTFPHIGNVGANAEDMESKVIYAKGIILRNDISRDSNYRSTIHFNDWLEEQNIIGITNVDTRAITRYIRKFGAENVLIFHRSPGEKFDWDNLYERLLSTPMQDGCELVAATSCKKIYSWKKDHIAGAKKVVVIDYGMKLNMLNCLENVGCEAIIVPSNTSASTIMKYNPDGIFLSNGPGDPKATASYAVPILKQLIATGIPIFGVCMGHQLLALALGAETEKMHQGHRGANHPVKNLITNQIEITTQNHGFVVRKESLPSHVNITHISLFDQTIEGIALKDKPVFSVQYHPESSPGPHDSHYLFNQFVNYMK
ncbi:Carbamoyl-phosphate synthase small chain [Rickettsiales bacterium Ac37b]|nr:Carbamoyl-phosphate synthase small chain [Rickettsiales bacterium Ac37b]